MGAYIKFGELRSDAYGWILTHTEYSEAAPKTNYLNIPGSNETIETEKLLTNGVPTYNRRTVKFVFYSKKTVQQRAELLSSLIIQRQGREVEIVESRDLEHYWKGTYTCAVSSEGRGTRIEVICDVEPFRYISNGNLPLLNLVGTVNERFYTYAKAQPLVINVKIGQITAVQCDGVTVRKTLGVGKHTIVDIVPKPFMTVALNITASNNAVYDVLYYGGEL